MADQQKYIVQLKLPGFPGYANFYGDYSKGFVITAQDDEEAIEKAREYLAERQRFGQGETGFRLLRLVREEHGEEG